MQQQQSLRVQRCLAASAPRAAWATHAASQPTSAARASATPARVAERRVRLYAHEWKVRAPHH